MLPHISHKSGVQNAPINQQIHGPAVHNSDLNHCKASAIVEKFIQKLSLELIKKSKNSKALSPASLTPVLGMLLAAMDNNGDIEKILGLTKGALTPELEAKVHHELGKYSKKHPYGESPIIATENFMASHYQCQDEGFEQILKDAYGTNVLAVTGVQNVADITDEFVAEKTRGEITGVFDGMSPEEREKMMFTMGNVLTFKGVWNSTFNENLTKPGKFHCADGRTINNIDMMHLTEKVECGSYNGFDIIIKDFESGTMDSLQFVAIIPDELSGESIKNLDVDTIDVLIQLAAGSKKSIVELTIPRMEIDSKTEGLEHQIGAALDVSIDAEKLSKFGISPGDPLNMFQKVKASINEKGAHGSVVTALSVDRACVPVTAFEFNRPGYIAIRNKIEGDILIEAFVKDDKFLVSRGNSKPRTDTDISDSDSDSDSDISDSDSDSDSTTFKDYVLPFPCGLTHTYNTLGTIISCCEKEPTVGNIFNKLPIDIKSSQKLEICKYRLDLPKSDLITQYLIKLSDENCSFDNLNRLKLPDNKLLNYTPDNCVTGVWWSESDKKYMYISEDIPRESRPSAEYLDRLTRLIGDKFNQNGDLEIRNIANHSTETCIFLGKLEDATILRNKIIDDLGSEFKDFVRLNKYNSSINIGSKASDKLKANLDIV